MNPLDPEGAPRPLDPEGSPLDEKFEHGIAALRHELSLKAITWARADRNCDDLAAALTRAEEEPAQNALKRLQINFQRACQHVEVCEEALKQTARELESALGRPDQ
jgi:hypothetical protein